MNNTPNIVLGAGCFWCIEAFLQLFKGIKSVTPGYAGGTSENPTYEQVCYGIGNHAEVVKVVYDPAIITLESLLEVFWAIHDPTTLNKQGYDKGPEYRSALYYSDPTELDIIQSALAKAQTNWPNQIVTEIKQLAVFYDAEDYHKNYFANNPNKAYCQIIINPKLKDIRKKFEFMMR